MALRRASFAKSIPTTSLQPFIGYIFNFDRWFLQGFTGSNIPTDSQVVTMYYNDVGVGYYLFRSNDPQLRRFRRSSLHLRFT